MFATTFVAVICLKILEERRDLMAEGEARQARAAAFLAERTSARLARAHGAAATAAAAVERAGASAERVAHDQLEALSASPLITSAAIITDAGETLEATDGADDARLARALERRMTAPSWVDRDPDAAPLVFTSQNVSFAGVDAVLVAAVAPAALPPTVAEDQILALTDAAGVVLTANGAADAPEPGDTTQATLGVDVTSAVEVRDRVGGAVAGALPPDDHGARVLGVAPVAGVDLTVVMTGPRQFDEALWRRTLLFYLLLLVAPILVAVGLCAVLLMQMENIRQARAALQDQERRFRLAIEGARCGVWDWNLTDDTVFVTDSLARMFGKRGSTTMKGSEFLSLVRAQDQDKVAQAIRNARNIGEVDVEFRAYSLPVWLQARGRPWTGAGDTPNGRVVGVAIDITEQKGAATRANAAENRLRAALESMSESFVVWDARRRLVLSNQKYSEFFHLEPKLVKPGAAYEMLELAAQGAIKAAHESAEDGARELELADGRWIHFSERRTQDGGLVSIGTDITALKQQEEQLVEKEKASREMVVTLQASQDRIAELARNYEQEKIKAQEANRSKSEFLANMSHELRTPLNAINGFSDIMIQEMFGSLGDARYKEYAQDILDSGRLLLALINDILDMSKIEAGKMQLSIESVNPDEVAEQCARLIRGKAREAKLDFVIDVADMPEIEADPRALKQVILNLLSNAVKFTPEGGTVEFQARPLDDGVRFRVKDTGIGIAAEDLPRIGKPFEQIESHQSRNHHGSGLGLALSRSLVEMHGGEFGIQSEIEKGTTVSFTLPLRAMLRPSDDADAADDTLDDDAEAAEPSAPVADPAPTTGATSSSASGSSGEASLSPGLTAKSPEPV